jgi:hypothetical protein
MPKSVDQWRARLRRFAADECRGSSRLYEVVSLGMADDTELLEWIVGVCNPRGDATLILAAVHDRLLAGADGDELAAFYPNLTARPAPADGAYPAFRAFVTSHSRRACSLARRTRHADQRSAPL